MWFFYCLNCEEFESFKLDLFVKTTFMTKKEYIEKAKNLIVNRVRFHAPILFDSEVDEGVLKESGIDASLPVFKFEKNLNRRLVKAFELAHLEEKFNLVISGLKTDRHNIKCIRQLEKMHNTTILGEYCSKRLLEMVNKLNINYSSSSNFNLVYQDKFFSVNGARLNPYFQDFSLCQEAVFEDVLVSYKEFVLNGQNIFVKFLNKTSQEKKLMVELNIPLEKGYYYFKRVSSAVAIENLISKEQMHFNFLCSGAKFSFSNVDGLENSVYCCVNVKIMLNLKPKQRKVMFFNFGESKFSVKNEGEIENLFSMATKQVRNIFDVQVKTREPKFDLFFNKSLPRKIWLNWLNGKADEALEQKYVTYRRLFVKGKEKISFVKFSEIGVKEIGIFNGEYYKKILIANGDESFLKVGRTYFYSNNDITKRTLTSREPVVLSFGK